MATTAVQTSSFRQLASLAQMPVVRQLGFMVLLAGAIALGSAVVLWSRTPDWSALYTDLPAQDSGEVIAALDQLGVQYRLALGSGIVTIPSDQVSQVRLQLANQGLPRRAPGGFDILDQQQSLGTSNFIEQARYNRALEQELAATIELIRAVREARVHLSIPRQSSFLRNGRSPTASVMLDILGGQSLSDTQLAGILHLVATSVAGLEPANVSIVDQNGNLLSRRGSGEYADGSEHLRYTRRIETDYVDRIVDILTPIVGPGNVRAQVSADVDYTFVETTEEAFDPASRTVRSEQTSEERSGGNAAPAVVEPGALSPEPPDVQPADANSLQAAVPGDQGRLRTNATRNYELDRTVSYIRSAPGSIRRLSVAVLVNLAPEVSEDGTVQAPDQARLDRLTQLVKDSIGFDQARGDSVNVVSEAFSSDPVFEETAAPPLWRQPWVVPVVKQALAGVVVLLLIFAVLRPALRTVVAAPALAHQPARALPGAGGDIDEDQVSLSGGAPRLARAVPERSGFDENLGLVQTLVEREPVRAARMIKEWVAND